MTSSVLHPSSYTSQIAFLHFTSVIYVQSDPLGFSIGESKQKGFKKEGFNLPLNLPIKNV